MEHKNICLLTSGHPSFDERIFWKFGKTFSEKDFNVTIISSTEDLSIKRDGINISSFNANQLSKKEKIDNFFNLLKEVKPDFIICSEPLPLLPASKYKNKINPACKIILDVTEFYPHQNTLNNFKGLKKFLVYLYLHSFNIYASNLADGIISGEINKSKLYKWIAPLKKKIIIGYFALKKYFQFISHNVKSELVFSYLGEQTEERGFFRFIEVIAKLSKAVNKKILLNLIGSGKNNKELLKTLLENLIDSKSVEIKFLDRIDYDKLPALLADSDFFIDLRSKTRIFNRSIPIRLFDYIAVGRPIIFSNLDSIKAYPDVSNLIHLVEPEDTDSAVKIIVQYLNDENLYIQKCKELNYNFEKQYNWELLGENLISFINSI